MDINLAPYIFLMLGMCFLWITPMRHLWQIPFLIALALGISIGRLGLFPLLPMAVFFLACYFSSYPKKILLPRFVLDLVILILGLMLLKLVIPGVSNWKIVSGFKISEDSIPYSFSLNFDKASVGIFLIATLVPLCRKGKEWFLALRVWLLASVLAIFVLLILSWILGYVRWDPKVPSFSLIWLFHNLFFVSVVEEAFFRGFLLQRIADYCRKMKVGNIIALVISSIIFGLIHFYGGLCYVFLSTVAGIIYGLAYLWSGKIESAILAHLTVNAVHFFFFSYPALAQRLLSN